MNKFLFRKLIPLLTAFMLITGVTADCASNSGGSNSNVVKQKTVAVENKTQANQVKNTKTPAVKKKVAFVYLSEKDASFAAPAENALKYLESNGYKLGKNLDYLKLTIETDPNKCGEVLEKLKQFKPDVVICDSLYTTDGVVKPILKENIPVVMMMDVDNTANKFIQTPQKPGGLVTGIKTLPSTIQTNSYKLLNEIAPIKGKKAVFITNPAAPVFNKADTEKALKTNGIQMKSFVEVKNFDEYKQAALKYNKDPEVGWILNGTWTPFDKNGKSVTEHEFMQWDATNNHKPGSAFWEAMVANGMLYGLVVDWGALGTQSAEIALKILNGEKPGNIPIEEPKVLNIIINKMRADALGITIPNSVLSGARRIYTDYNGKYTEQK